MIRLAIRVGRADAELVLAELLELAPDGVEEAEPAEGVVEYALYGAPGELPALPDVRAVAGGALVEVSTSELADDWDLRWREFHRPAEIRPAGAAATTLRVRPPWEPSLPGGAGTRLEIVIDPGQAFGTGAHATTRLSLELLLELHGALHPRGEAAAGVEDRTDGVPLLDVGTGSGVLAIAAARLGFAPVIAVDFDPESVAAADENARANDVEIDVRRLDLLTERLPAPAVGAAHETIVLANLLRPLLLELAGALAQAPAHLIASGMLADETDEVAGAFERTLGMRVRARRERGGWSALWLAR